MKSVDDLRLLRLAPGFLLFQSCSDSFHFLLLLCNFRGSAPIILNSRVREVCAVIEAMTEDQAEAGECAKGRTTISDELDALLY